MENLSLSLLLKKLLLTWKTIKKKNNKRMLERPMEPLSMSLKEKRKKKSLKSGKNNKKKKLNLKTMKKFYKLNKKKKSQSSSMEPNLAL